MAEGAAHEDWLSSRDSVAEGDDIGGVVREYRLASGQNQAAAAAALGTTQQHLSQIERGARTASLELRRKLAEVLDIPSEALGLARRVATASPDGPSGSVTASRGRWRAQRAWLNRHRSELAQLAVRLYPSAQRVPKAPLIAAEGWIPPEPVPLRSLALDLDEQPQGVSITGRGADTVNVRPLHNESERYSSYTSAIRHLDPPALFESRPSYRLLNADLRDSRLQFGLAAYFDKLDVSEALGHELAAACMAGGIPDAAAAPRGHLPFRESIANPFDTAARAVIPAITTLTIRLRRYPKPPSFLLHWRDPAKVATAGGVYDVIPAGEFQPSSVALWDRRNDFDLWRNMVREYSEELLGAPEHDGTRSEPIDYAGWTLYQQLERAQADGSVSAHLLGIALDALTLAATILTVVVIDDDQFEAIFGNAVRFNEEGEIVGIGDGRATEGVPFTEDAVERMLSSEPMASPGAGCLALAWKHRSHLLPYGCNDSGRTLRQRKAVA